MGLLPGLLLVALGVVAGCPADDPEDTSDPCDTEAFVNRCEDTTQVWCREGSIVRYDCASQQESCRLNQEGIGYCTKAIPEGVDERGACAGSLLQKKDGEILLEWECSENTPPYTCARDADGIAWCTLPVPADVDAAGRCEGTRLLKKDGDVLMDWDCKDSTPPMTCALDEYAEAWCSLPVPTDVGAAGSCDGTRLLKKSGDVLVDVDCADQQKTCALDSKGTAYCTLPCPTGVGPFGRCIGERLQRCDGDTLIDTDCAAKGQRCEPDATRSGAGCVGCGEVPPGGYCADNGVLVTCTLAGFSWRSHCTGIGGQCRYDDQACESTCGVPEPACDTEDLEEGKSKCRRDDVTGFASVVSCKNGLVEEEECPAASDGSVACTDTPDGARCTTTCSFSGRRCTDRGVLLICDDTPTLSWLDCPYFGGTCKEEGTEAFCACTGMSPQASRCHEGRKRVCTEGRITSEPCTCGPAPVPPAR